MVASAEAMRAAVIRNLEKRTGNDLVQWVRIAKRSRVRDRKGLCRWLKIEHGLGATTCRVIADAVLGTQAEAPESAMLALQYAGDKSALRPVYDRLVREILKLGGDVTHAVRKTQTTFARAHTFAIAKAPTRTRIDLGLRLPGVKATKRLQATAAFSGNATHCVQLSAPSEVDAELKRYLKAAYEARK